MPIPKLTSGVTILHGDDEYSIDRILAAWYTAMGDPSMADLNTTRLDGKTYTENDLRTAVQSMPFLADYRLVILTNPLSRFASETVRNRFLELLERIPTTTALALVISDQPGRKNEWEILKSNHWLRKWVVQHPEISRIADMPLPQPGEMIRWIMDTARKQQGQMTQAAANELFKHVGNDTRLASQEITKLLTYVNNQRPVDAADVSLLVAQQGEVDVFKMVDALGQRDSKTASGLVETLLEKQDPLSVLGIISRHFRLLLLVREVIEGGGGPLVVMEHLGREPFRISNKYYAEKLWGQARKFSMVRLESAFRQLVGIDTALKTSQMDANTAFAIFITELTQAG